MLVLNACYSLMFYNLLFFSQHTIDTCNVPSYNLNRGDTGHILYQ